ncbi:hypothetical protein SDC9_93980 [bioreactor metagenome]|uniref:Uncharacterized protein n=1 Tax=bioreactor metagenome TaxID=1076179 RepID=A0A645A2L8_9ZZZZ
MRAIHHAPPLVGQVDQGRPPVARRGAADRVPGVEQPAHLRGDGRAVDVLARRQFPGPHRAVLVEGQQQPQVGEHQIRHQRPQSVQRRLA